MQYITYGYYDEKEVPDAPSEAAATGAAASGAAAAGSGKRPRTK